MKKRPRRVIEKRRDERKPLAAGRRRLSSLVSSCRARRAVTTPPRRFLSRRSLARSLGARTRTTLARGARAALARPRAGDAVPSRLADRGSDFAAAPRTRAHRTFASFLSHDRHTSTCRRRTPPRSRAPQAIAASLGRAAFFLWLGDAASAPERRRTQLSRRETRTGVSSRVAGFSSPPPPLRRRRRHVLRRARRLSDAATLPTRARARDEAGADNASRTSRAITAAFIASNARPCEYRSTRRPRRVPGRLATIRELREASDGREIVAARRNWVDDPATRDGVRTSSTSGGASDVEDGFAACSAAAMISRWNARARVEVFANARAEDAPRTGRRRKKERPETRRVDRPRWDDLGDESDGETGREEMGAPGLSLVVEGPSRRRRARARGSVSSARMSASTPASGLAAVPLIPSAASRSFPVTDARSHATAKPRETRRRDRARGVGVEEDGGAEISQPTRRRDHWSRRAQGNRRRPIDVSAVLRSGSPLYVGGGALRAVGA